MSLNVKIIVALVLSGALIFVGLNSHMDFFPCESREYDAHLEKIVVSENDTCSLMYVFKDDYNRDGEKHELTAVGWGVAAAFFVLLPFAVVFGVGAFIGRKRTT